MTTKILNQLESIEWELPAGAAARPASTPPSIRDVYIAARFPGLARSGADLEDVTRVVEGARLFFEDTKIDRALELLDLAVEQCPVNEPLRLARLEIAFLLRDSALYTAHAKEFRQVLPASTAWIEITRLGRAVAPTEEIFGAKQGDRAHEHYGPWPHMPNWIQASWDLTPEVLAADYHRTMARAPRTSGERTPTVAS